MVIIDKSDNGRFRSHKYSMLRIYCYICLYLVAVLIALFIFLLLLHIYKFPITIYIYFIHINYFIISKVLKKMNQNQLDQIENFLTSKHREYNN